MAWTVELYDTESNTTIDISDRTLEIVVNEALDSETTTFSIYCKGIYEEHLFDHVTITRDGTLYLSGLVVNQIDEDGGNQELKLTTFECDDWGHLLSKRIVAQTYLSSDLTLGRPDLIIKDLLTINANEFTSTNTKTVTTNIDVVKFDYISIRDAIEQIFDMLDFTWHWYIDKNKDFHLFQYYESTGLTFDETNINKKTLKVQYTGTEHSNKVWVVGIKQASANAIDEYFAGDGTQRYFKLAYEPNDTNIYVDNVLKSSKLEQNDDGGQDFLINKTQKVFYIPSNITTPFSGTIKANYKPTKQFIDVFENRQDITKYGKLEKVVKNTDVTDRISARRYGQAEIRKNATVRRKVSFQSRAANSLKIGQRVYVNVTTTYWDVQGYFLVKSIKRAITPLDEMVQFELEELV